MSHWQMVPAPGRWALDGNCADLRYVGLFDPAEDGRQRRATSVQRRIARAREVCTACPVIAECRAYADTDQPHGVWAGRVYTGLRDHAREYAQEVA